MQACEACTYLDKITREHKNKSKGERKMEAIIVSVITAAGLFGFLVFLQEDAGSRE
jgi:hypothetical protein